MMTILEKLEELGIPPELYAVVKITLDRLTDEDLAAQRLALGLGYDPRVVVGWDQIKPLYDGADDGDPPRPHQSIREIIEIETARRLRARETP